LLYPGPEFQPEIYRKMAARLFEKRAELNSPYRAV
jgi:hypothetical protein